MRRRLHISKGPLSFGVTLRQHNFRNILLSDYLRRQIYSVSCRTTTIRCHSFSAGGKANEPAVKVVYVMLTKNLLRLITCFLCKNLNLSTTRTLLSKESCLD